MKNARPEQSSTGFEARATPFALASLPTILKELLSASVSDEKRRKSVLLSSNSLANRFILEKWGIRPSQRKRNKNLFSISRKHARRLFRMLLETGRIEWCADDVNHAFGVFRFDEIRGNLILGFAPLDPDSPWNSPSFSL